MEFILCSDLEIVQERKRINFCHCKLTNVARYSPLCIGPHIYSSKVQILSVPPKIRKHTNVQRIPSALKDSLKLFCSKSKCTNVNNV